MRGCDRYSSAVTWRVRILGALLAVVLLTPGSVWANAGTLPDTIDVLLDSGAHDLEATFGMLLEDQSGVYHWVCHETLVPPNSTTTPRFFRSANGALLATVGGLGIAYDPNDTLFYSTDGGCNFEPVVGVSDTVVWDVAFDPGDASHALASTAHLAGATNGIWVSNDDGASWAKTNLDVASRLFLSVMFSEADPSVVYATAAWFDPSAQGYSYRSTNSGQDYTETLFDFAPSGDQEGIVYYVATSPTDPLVAYVRVDGLTTDWLRRTVDGGANFTTVLQLDDNILDVAVDDNGDIYVVAQVMGLYRSTDGTTFNPVASTPLVRGIDADADGVWVAVSQLSDGYALGVTPDSGSSFEQRFVFKDLDGPLPCPAGSEVFDICGPLWPALAQQLGITIPSPNDHWPDDPWGLHNRGRDQAPTCKCASALPPRSTPLAPLATGLVFVAALAVWRRRRRTQGKRAHGRWH